MVNIGDLQIQLLFQLKGSRVVLEQINIILHFHNLLDGVDPLDFLSLGLLVDNHIDFVLQVFLELVHNNHALLLQFQGLLGSFDHLGRRVLHVSDDLLVVVVVELVVLLVELVLDELVQLLPDFVLLVLDALFQNLLLVFDGVGQFRTIVRVLDVEVLDEVFGGFASHGFFLLDGDLEVLALAVAEIRVGGVGLVRPDLHDVMNRGAFDLDRLVFRLLFSSILVVQLDQLFGQNASQFLFLFFLQFINFLLLDLLKSLFFKQTESQDFLVLEQLEQSDQVLDHGLRGPLDQHLSDASVKVSVGLVAPNGLQGFGAAAEHIVLLIEAATEVPVLVLMVVEDGLGGVGFEDVEGSADVQGLAEEDVVFDHLPLSSVGQVEVLVLVVVAHLGGLAFLVLVADFEVVQLPNPPLDRKRPVIFRKQVDSDIILTEVPDIIPLLIHQLQGTENVQKDGKQIHEIHRLVAPGTRHHILINRRVQLIGDSIRVEEAEAQHPVVGGLETVHFLREELALLLFEFGETEILEEFVGVGEAALVGRGEVGAHVDLGLGFLDDHFHAGEVVEVFHGALGEGEVVEVAGAVALVGVVVAVAQHVEVGAHRAEGKEGKNNKA